MIRFPSLEGKEVITVLKDHGFFVDRQRGSHCYLRHDGGRATVVPVHAGETIDPACSQKSCATRR